MTGTAGPQLVGAAVLADNGRACRLDYKVTCDLTWQTRSAVISGWVGGRDIDITVRRDGDGTWTVNGTDYDTVRGCVDVDLNFSPSTNTLPIRRLALEIGESAAVVAAWLRFPGFELERLEQTYTRLTNRVYRYESGGGRFVAEVTVDAQGLVLDYGGIWSRVVAA